MPLTISNIQGEVQLDGLRIFGIQGHWPALPPQGEGECALVLTASSAGIAWKMLGIAFNAFADKGHFLVVGFDLTVDGNFGDRPFHVRTAVDVPCELNQSILTAFDAAAGGHLDEGEAIILKIAECVPKGLMKFREGSPPRYVLHPDKTEMSGYYLDVVVALLAVLGLITFFLAVLCTGLLVQAADRRHKLLPRVRTMPKASTTGQVAGPPLKGGASDGTPPQ
mmetsp:Transcript_13125/g.24174  ORF Transcript_13125/g.24174 Transcript_13125/m.24174 type:complete len:223 (+) Transcript_13125:1082-1750(+)